MNKPLLAALLFSPVVLMSAADAQTYQWKDSSGRTVISDTPPPASVREKRSIGTRQPAVVTDTGGGEEKASSDKPVATTPQTMEEKELEFRKRQQEAREKAEKERKEAEAARVKRENCDRARNNYRLLQSDNAVSQTDARGNVQVMDDSQRRRELERTRRIMQEACR